MEANIKDSEIKFAADNRDTDDKISKHFEPVIHTKCNSPSKSPIFPPLSLAHPHKNSFTEVPSMTNNQTSETISPLPESQLTTPVRTIFVSPIHPSDQDSGYKDDTDSLNFQSEMQVAIVENDNTCIQGSTVSCEESSEVTLDLDKNPKRKKRLFHRKNKTVPATMNGDLPSALVNTIPKSESPHQTTSAELLLYPSSTDGFDNNSLKSTIQLNWGLAEELEVNAK